MDKTYLELETIQSFDQRFEYLSLNGKVGESTFGSKRYLNQTMYRTSRWKSLRNKVILRDNGCDLGIEGREITGKIIIHHINPITIEDVLNDNPKVYDMNNLICVSHNTHEAIHYGDKNILTNEIVERSPNDTCPWKNKT